MRIKVDQMICCGDPQGEQLKGKEEEEELYFFTLKEKEKFGGFAIFGLLCNGFSGEIKLGCMLLIH